MGGMLGEMQKEREREREQDLATLSGQFAPAAADFCLAKHHPMMFFRCWHPQASIMSTVRIQLGAAKVEDSSSPPPRESNRIEKTRGTRLIDIGLFKQAGGEPT